MSTARLKMHTKNVDYKGHPPRPRRDDMTTKKSTFKTIPVGTKVSWHYRSAIGHGTVAGVHEMGTNADNTMYSVRETDHHPGEPAIVHHSGKALSRA
jgi:hypothetical protein